MSYDRAVVPTALNPALTPELQQEVSFFLKWGYLVVENAVSERQVAVLRGALDDTVRDRDEPFTHRLLEEDDRFAFLLDNPPVLRRITALLGTCVQLHSATARVTRPGEPDQDWHRDGPWPVDPDGTPIGGTPGQINCGYYLDELTAENGPIAIVPGSQRAPFRPPKGHPEFPGPGAGAGEAGPGGAVQRLALPPRGGKPLRPPAPGVPDVLPERLDEIARAVRRTARDPAPRTGHGAAEASARSRSALVAAGRPPFRQPSRSRRGSPIHQRNGPSTRLPGAFR